MANESIPDVVGTLMAVVKLLADDPDSVAITTSPGFDGSTVLLQIVAPREELGRLVGVSGRTARALRAILNNISLAQGTRYSLEILEKS